MTAHDGVSHPNILLLVTDEERDPPAYESAELAAWRRTHLPARQRLLDSGFKFPHHYTVTSACVPSRTTLYTGTYPSHHGVKCTWGGPGKEEDDPRVTLKPGTVPTMGDYFEAAGYDTNYIGKWHISHEDLHRQDGRVETDPGAYRKADPLSKFGFHGWTGPEPHGTESRNSGIARDPGFANEACEWLSKRPSSAERPFLLAVNLVNPHDIVACSSEAEFLWGLRKVEEFDSVPVVQPPPEELKLSTKPSTQASWITQYPKMFSSPFRPGYYHGPQASAWRRRMYYALHARVDLQLQRVLDALEASPFGANTIIAFTADHGEMLGAQGGLCQKWYTAYEEALRVPWVIAGKVLFQSAASSKLATSLASSYQGDTLVSGSVDILPTLLGLSGLDIDSLTSKLQGAERHLAVTNLPGRDWSTLIHGVATGHLPALPSRAVYLELEDHMSDAPLQVHPVAKNAGPFALLPLGPLRGVVARKLAFDTVSGPPHIEAVVANVTGMTGLWKLVRYWDNPAAWSQPGVRNEYVIREGKNRGVIEIRSEPLPDEWALYNLTSDPTEMHNLVRTDGSPVSEQVATTLAQLHEELRDAAGRHRGMAPPSARDGAGRAGLVWHPREVGPIPLLSKL